MTSGLLLILLLVFLVGRISGQTTDDQICTTSNNNTFTVRVNLFAGEIGYFTFEECGGDDNPHPTIGLKVGETYTFVQKDISNWMHPMGFAYYPDGDHDNQLELGPTTNASASACPATLSCPSPYYYLNEEYLGKNGTNDTGVDTYEPYFQRFIVDWVNFGNFTIQLNFNDRRYKQDIFYFCHVHEFMSGRIKLLDSDGNAINGADEPTFTTTKYHYQGANDTYYDVLGPFDQQCASYGLDQYQLPNSQCPAQFICHDVLDTSGSSSTASTKSNSEFGIRGGGSDDNEIYAQCFDANNCMMLSEITRGIPSGNDEITLFIQQMIPHHQNAVNMAKNVLRLKNATNNVLPCDDITNQDDYECMMEAMLREVVNAQNHEIQIMFKYLQSQNITYVDDCNVSIETLNTTVFGSSYKKTPGSDDDIVRPPNNGGIGSGSGESSQDTGTSAGYYHALSLYYAYYYYAMSMTMMLFATFTFFI